MTKKPAALFAGLVAVKGKAEPVHDMPPRSAAIEIKAASQKTVPLNFKLTPELVKRFKARAVADDMKLNELFEAAFAAYERERGD
jgi:hypothetical protein